jgi:hypothetical protein
MACKHGWIEEYCTWCNGSAEAEHKAKIEKLQRQERLRKLDEDIERTDKEIGRGREGDWVWDELVVLYDRFVDARRNASSYEWKVICHAVQKELNRTSSAIRWHWLHMFIPYDIEGFEYFKAGKTLVEFRKSMDKADFGVEGK